MKAKLKKLWADKDANTAMIGAVVGIMVTIIIAVLVFYNIAASIDTADIDAEFGAGTPAGNATNATLDQAETFFTIAPIIGIVVVAVVILDYVSRIGG